MFIAPQGKAGLADLGKLCEKEGTSVRNILVPTTFVK
jgi:hypothetical protein